MPPCAATLCARRGLSWKQKQWTSYPSSASVAAAEAPASPEPTTRTLYRRLFAGLTSFISSRQRSHFVASGPSGTRGSSFISRRSRGDLARKNENRNGAVSDDEGPDQCHADHPYERLVALMVHAKRL